MQENKKEVMSLVIKLIWHVVKIAVLLVILYLVIRHLLSA